MLKRANPFFTNGPVDADYFIGRRVEVSKVFDQLASHAVGSVSIVGERRIGKTSLLRYVSRPEVIRQRSLDASKYIISFQDCGAISPFTVNNFWRTILRRIARDIRRKKDASNLNEYVQELLGGGDIDLVSIEFLLDEMAEEGYRFILILDEFEWCVRTDPENEATTRAFLGGMRSLVNHVPRVLSLIVATRLPLDEVCRDVRDMGSPFYNSLVLVTLRPFTMEETASLFERMLIDTGISFSDDEQKFIYDLAGTQPQLLQVAADLIYRVKKSLTKEVNDYSPIRREFKEQVGRFFYEFWAQSKARERTILKGLAQADHDVVDQQLEEWKNERESLISRGLILKRADNNYAFLSSAFWEWLIDNLYRLEEIHGPRSRRQDHLEQQLADHLRRLRILEEQEARFGKTYVPSHLVLDIKDTRSKIEQLQAKIAER